MDQWGIRRFYIDNMPAVGTVTFEYTGNVEIHGRDPMRKRSGRSAVKVAHAAATPHPGSPDLLALFTIAMLGGQAWQHLTTGRDLHAACPGVTHPDIAGRRRKPSKRRAT
jgi:hypothetical protein